MFNGADLSDETTELHVSGPSAFLSFLVIDETVFGCSVGSSVSVLGCISR